MSEGLQKKKLHTEENYILKENEYTIIEMGRPLLYKNISLQFWDEAIRTTAYVFNRNGPSSIV